VYTARAEGYIYLNDTESALADLDAAIKLGEDNIKSFYNRAIILEDLGKYDLAIKDYDKVIDLNPEDALSLFNRANCYAQKNDLSRAVADLKKAVTLVPDNVDYLRALGNTKYQLSELDDDPCSDWIKAAELGDKKSAFAADRYCNNK